MLAFMAQNLVFFIFAPSYQAVSGLPDPTGEKERHNSESDSQVSILQNLFSSSLTFRTNKLELLFLETLSSQVLEFKGKARANPIGAPFRWYLLG
jgi:hypothetical protein